MAFDWNNKEWSNWLLADDAGGALAEFTTYLGSQVKGEANVTYDYVENGSFAAYNKTVSPLDINVKLARDGTAGELQQTLKLLQRLTSTTELFSFVTPMMEHRNMTMVSYDYAFNEGNAITTLVVDIHLLEIRESNSEFTNVEIVEPISSGDAAEPSDTSTVDTGNKQPTEGDEKKQKSVAKDLKDIFGL